MTTFVEHQLGNYRLLSLIGRGGFADVYVGEHIHLNTLAAIKVLQMRLTGHNLEQFRNEARTIANLAHPNIVRVLDFGIAENIPYLVMEYASNGTLRQRHPKGTPLSPLSIVPYLQQIAGALQYAHDSKLVHRDIKPENMLIGSNNKVLLSDFGLVLTAQSTGSRSSRELGGTVPYMAPEQLQGRPRPASDQYSLGIVIYEWLSGDRPFHGTFTEIASQHLLVPPPPLRNRIPGIFPQIEQVVLKALAKDPQQRFASIKAFASAFEEACHAIQPYPDSGTYSTVQMEQSWSSTFVIQPDPGNRPTYITPILSAPSAQSTVAYYSAGEPLPPKSVQTPQLQSSNTRRHAWKWSITIAACLLIIAMLILLPLQAGTGTSKSAVTSNRASQSTPDRTVPTPTSTSLPKAKPTTAPALNLNTTPTPIPTSQSVPTPTPVTPTPIPVTPTPTTSPPHGPGVTASNLTPGQCSTNNQGWTCSDTLSEVQNNTTNLAWSASTSTAGVSFNPQSGTLSPGQTNQVSIAIPLSDCNDTFTFKGPIDTVQVSWNCTLTAPVQLSPASGTVFNTYPRTTTLQWTVVQGAASYTVQIYYYQPGDTTCSGGAQDYLTPNITSTSYTFNFVGAQPGCWRVWAVDDAGRQSPASDWWEFSYTI